ncbi:MAG: CRISPR system precrRNA processing endoribonuclease RAMP protein Cas6 [Desulfobacterales bacterium]|nr:CRISPR system precrRNA processing endoribonuclease RAMP protein Cas6 [Desulfobacterales bacterium]
MDYGKYDFFCSFDTDAILPIYKGSTFRGVFGHALKKVICALKRQECHECLLKDKCIYVFIFETSLLDKFLNKITNSALPHPFVIEPPLNNLSYFQKGSLFDFSLLLFGKANYYLPYFIYAFDQIGKSGIGKGSNQNMGKFTLREVKTGQNTIYSCQDQKIANINCIESLSYLNERNDTKDNIAIKIKLDTPLRLKFENKFKADLPFHILVRAMLRRMSSLLNAFGDGEPDLDYKGMVNRANDVKIIESDLRWFDWKRYSNRQDCEMLMGGMVGTITYEGNISEYIQLIDFCSKVHLGKQTAFGLGKITIDYGEKYG